jgi:hypothetical protein
LWSPHPACEAETTVELNFALGLVEIRLADFALDADSGSQINQTMSMALP